MIYIFGRFGTDEKRKTEQKKTRIKAKLSSLNTQHTNNEQDMIENREKFANISFEYFS